MNKSVTFLGIRHHGPGSAHSMLRALEQLRPDIVLVEGPPDAQDLLPWVQDPQLQPPVALLLYVSDQPQKAVYYPFAEFSPEWQAIKFGLSREVPVRFMDLPQAFQLAARQTDLLPVISDGQADHLQITRDPLSWLAGIAGFRDGERWWEFMVEKRQTPDQDLFTAIAEMMGTLRSGDQWDLQLGDNNTGGELVISPLPLEAEREAWMRQMIGEMQADGFGNIAVICGAWHVPALKQHADAQADKKLLKGLKKVRVAGAWVPWSYGRLSRESGYGAGVESPGWYEALWQAACQGLDTADISIRWLTRAAQVLRSEDLSASSAHVIEAVRLAESLASLRGQALPGLDELNDAARSVFCSGDNLPLRLVYEKLVINERLGRVPEGAPMTPLQADLVRQQKSLRLPPEASQRDMDLDLRKPNDLKRSFLLHRLALLDIPWGELKQVSGKSGSFHEMWCLQWEPALAVKVVEASLWGNTLEEAAQAYIRHFLAQEELNLSDLTALVNRALLAELPGMVEELMIRLERETALSSDTGQLMDALPALAEVLRYGNVRQTDTVLVSRVVDGLVTRICIGLPPACSSLDDEAARKMFARVNRVMSALLLLHNEFYLKVWYETLKSLAGQMGLHGLLAGRVCSILLQQGLFSEEEISCRLGLALSTAAEPVQAAAWVEGLLIESGVLLIHENALWEVLDDWVSALPGEVFNFILPLLRRTFSTFTYPERKKIGEKAKNGAVSWQPQNGGPTGFDLQAAGDMLPLLEKLLGLQQAGGADR